MNTNDSNMSLMTCSPYDGLTDFEKQVPTLDEIKCLSADQIHQRLGDALLGATVDYLTATNLIADIKCRLQNGEVIGGCKNWTSYVDTHIRKADESLPTVVRRLYRRLDGKAVNRKHDGSANRKKKTQLGGSPPPEPNCQPVDEEIEGQESAPELPDQNRFVTDTTPTDSETLIETFYIHTSSDEKPTLKSLGTRWDDSEATADMKTGMLYMVNATYVVTAVSQ